MTLFETFHTHVPQREEEKEPAKKRNKSERRKPEQRESLGACFSLALLFSLSLLVVLVFQISRWVRNGVYEVLGPFIHALQSDPVCV